MATHSSILAWRMPWLEEPGRLQSTGSQLPPPQFGLRSNDREETQPNHQQKIELQIH